MGDQHEAEGCSLVLQEIIRGNEALSEKLGFKTAEIGQSISGLKTVTENGSRITEAEEWISKAEKKLTEPDSRVLRLSDGLLRDAKLR